MLQSSRALLRTLEARNPGSLLGIRWTFHNWTSQASSLHTCLSGSTRCRHYSSSGNDKLLRDDEENGDARLQQEATETKSENRRRKNKLVKLHKRELTELEKEEDLLLSNSLENLEAEDSFGSLYLSKLQKTKNSHLRKSVSKNSETKQENVLEFNREPSQKSHLKTVHSFKKDGQFLGKHRNRISRNWADTFGNLSDGPHEATYYETEIGDASESQEASNDKEEGRHFIRLSATGRRNTQVWYGLQIEKLGKQGKTKEAIEVLEEWMLKRDRVMPTPYVFTVLIGVLGRAGYTHKAFKLFVKMKQMGLQPEDPTYTALFNACSNSPFQGDGLSRATRFREQMIEKGHQPNLTTYKAMIKAFGICGDLRTAFALMDEASKNYKLDQECFSSLLMACISDKKAGFKHAIEVWRLMLKKKVEPDLPLYNLLLRTVRDCGAGGSEFANQLLNSPGIVPQLKDGPLKGGNNHPIETEFLVSDEPVEESKELGSKTVEGSALHGPSSESSILKVGKTSDPSETYGMEWWQYDKKAVPSLTTVLPSQESSVHVDDSTGITVSQGNLQKCVTLLPDILNPLETLQGVLALGDLSTREDRLALLGGTKGFLRRMKITGTVPDVRIFAQLLDTIPSTLEAEAELLAVMEMRDVKPDVDLFNMLIHRRCMRVDYQAAKDVLNLVAATQLSANLRTFGCLALTCDRKSDGLQLVQDIQTAGLMPNPEIMGSLVKKSYMDFSYKKALLREMDNLAISPNRILIEHIEKAIAKARRLIVDREKGPKQKEEENKTFERNFWSFMEFYDLWLQRTKFEKPAHPWAPFGHMKNKQPQQTNTVL